MCWGIALWTFLCLSAVVNSQLRVLHVTSMVGSPESNCTQQDPCLLSRAFVIAVQQNVSSVEFALRSSPGVDFFIPTSFSCPNYSNPGPILSSTLESVTFRPDDSPPSSLPPPSLHFPPPNVPIICPAILPNLINLTLSNVILPNYTMPALDFRATKISVNLIRISAKGFVKPYFPLSLNCPFISGDRVVISNSTFTDVCFVMLSETSIAASGTTFSSYTSAITLITSVVPISSVFILQFNAHATLANCTFANSAMMGVYAVGLGPTLVMKAVLFDNITLHGIAFFPTAPSSAPLDGGVLLLDACVFSRISGTALMASNSKVTILKSSFVNAGFSCVPPLTLNPFSNDSLHPLQRLN
jgi:hypothetical protein